MFDQKKLQKNRKKSIDSIQISPFYQFIYSDIIDRLEPLSQEFTEILIIIEPSINNSIAENLRNKTKEANITIISVSDLQQNWPSNKFDLIIFPLGIHWINELEFFLAQIKQSLKNDGIFICNFPGAGSLRNLRLKLIELEAIENLPHRPHISPFLQFEQITPILQHTGFMENIIDMEPLELEYDSPLKLMKALKNHGESNVLNNGVSYSITKKMQRKLKEIKQEPFSDFINLITFISSPLKNSIKLKAEHYLG